MLEYKNIEEELDNFLSTIDKEINNICIKKENLKIIQNEISKIGDNNEELNLSDIKNNLNYIENANENLKYAKYYQSLLNIETEKDYYNKFILMIKLVRIFYLKFNSFME